MNEGERERPRWHCGPYPSREAGEEQVGMAAVLALSSQGRRLPVLPDATAGSIGQVSNPKSFDLGYLNYPKNSIKIQGGSYYCREAPHVFIWKF